MYSAKTVMENLVSVKSYTQSLDDIEDRLEPTLLPLPSHLRIKKIAAGNEFTFLLSFEGAVYSFGFNGSGQLGLNNTSKVCVPTNVHITEDKVTRIIASNGCEHCFSITTNGHVWAMGYNNYGQLGINSQGNVSTPILVKELANNYKITSAACSYYHSVFIGRTKNNVECVLSCGRNENGQVLLLSDLAWLCFRNCITHTQSYPRTC